jgi:hypothetical protein
MNEQKTMTTSIVIELDNATFSESRIWSARLLQLLAWVHAETKVKVVDIVIAYSEAMDAEVKLILRQLSDANAELMLLPVCKDNAHYYAMKNAGAEVASGDIVVFLDSDLEPYSGSLFDLIYPLYSGKQVVSCGAVGFPFSSFVSRVLALSWVFPILGIRESIPKNQLLVNNCAFNRAWFLNHKFRTDLGGFKVACHVLSIDLRSEGFKIQHPDVWFVHDVWNSTMPFVFWRARVMGSDSDKKYSYLTSSSHRARCLNSIKHLWLDFKRVAFRHIHYAHHVGMPIWQVPCSFVAGLLFWVTVRMSQFLSSLRRIRHLRDDVPGNFIT